MWPVISGIVAAIITAGVTAYLGRRSKTGSIRTSEAKDLWDTLRAELTRLQGEATSLRAEISTAHLEMTALREEAGKVRVEFAELKAAIAVCNNESDILRSRLEEVTRASRNG